MVKKPSFSPSGQVLNNYLIDFGMTAMKPSFLRLIICAAVMSCLAACATNRQTLSPVAAQVEFQAGVDAYDRQDFTTAFEKWLVLAGKGVAEAQNGVGLLYFKGQGVRQDDSLAVAWFRKAAEQGLAKAQNNLGLMYAYGRGVKQDKRIASDWFDKAAAQGQGTSRQYLEKLEQ